MTTEPRDPRLSFDRVPEDYERARHQYPPEAFEWLFDYLWEGRSADVADILEIGPGTGQATESLLRHGARVEAIEIGPNLAAFLRAKYAGNDALEVVTGEFEKVELASTFDLVLAATSFHWLDPEVRLEKAHQLLRPAGVLGILSTVPIRSSEDRGFFQRNDGIYRRWGRDGPPFDPPEENDVRPPEYDELQSSGLFADVLFRRFRWDQRYTAETYAQLLRSYSDIQMMQTTQREGLISDLRDFIEQEFDGHVVRPLVICLTVGRVNPARDELFNRRTGPCVARAIR